MPNNSQVEHKAALTLRNKAAAKFVERAKSLKLKGRTREDRAMEYMIGAVSVIVLTHPAAAHDLSGWVTMVLAYRPYETVVEAANAGA